MRRTRSFRRGDGDARTLAIRRRPRYVERSAAEALDRELSASYGWPVDVAGKCCGLAVVATALERGDLALAKIAALLLRFPDPPSLTKGGSASGSPELAERLLASGLLKDWDPSKHPRTGEPPNRGWFARKPDEPGTNPLAPGGDSSLPDASRGSGSDPPAPEGIWRRGLRALRELLKDTAKEVIEAGEFALWTSPKVRIAVEIALAAMEVVAPVELNVGEQQAIDQSRAAIDPPKSLEDLRTPPTQNVLGYEQHHIVEQNPSNVVKSPIESLLEKFGRAVIDDPSNIVWVPRLKHELITAHYNSKDSDTGRLRRQVASDMDYDAQYAAGLAALQLFGVLE